VVPELQALGRERQVGVAVGVGLARDDGLAERLGHDAVVEELVRVDRVVRRLVADVADEVLVGDLVVEHVVEEAVRDHRLRRARRHRHDVVEDRPALRLVPVREHVGLGALGQVGDDPADHVARPALVQEDAPGGHGLVVGDRDLDADFAVELLEVGAGALEQLGVLGVEVGDAAAHERHAGRLARVVEDRHLAAVLLGLRAPERVPRLVELARVEVEQVVAPGDPGRVGDVRDGVARADVVERAVQLGPDVLLEVGDQLVVERLQQPPAHQARELIGGREDDVELQAPGAELGERLVEGVERRHPDADVLLLAEGLEHLGVEVVGVVVDVQLAAALGLGGARDDVAELGHDDRVVLAGQRDPGAVDRRAGGRVAEDALAARVAARGRHGRGRVLATRERRRRAAGQGQGPAAAQQRPSRHTLRLGRF
jgi:hypothetical protein